MTEAYDLSSANLGRVANQDVDLLRIANQVVWAAERPEYTIFDGAALTLDSYNDSHSGESWLANQFQRYSGPDLEILGVGLYVPAGSMLIGQTGAVRVLFNTTPYVNGSVYSNSSANELAMASALVAGWNWYDYPTPLAWTSANPNILAEYNLREYYLYSSTLNASAIPSTGSKFELVAALSGGTNPIRAWYATTTNALAGTASRSYGIDVRIREA